jgi:hypothetical protein
MWLRVDTTPAAITKDLEEMHAKGIEGAILWDSGGTGLPGAPTKMLLGGKDYSVVRTQDYRGAHATPIPLPLMKSWTPPARARLEQSSGIFVAPLECFGVVVRKSGEVVIPTPRYDKSHVPFDTETVPGVAGYFVAILGLAGRHRR